MKNLVIVESPAKGKTIEKFLWKDYRVEASFGHIRDLPEKNIGIDIPGGFIPMYEISPEKKKRVSELKALAKTAEKVWIATDEDREWEAIGWHLCHALWLPVETTSRIVFHEITKTAIEKAIAEPRNIDTNLVNAQQSRRVLDRIVWYEVSPVLWKKVRTGLSAWRVQSIAVKLIVEREREIQAFIPEESWKIFAHLQAKNMNFPVEFTKIQGKNHRLKTLDDAKEFFQTLWIESEKIVPSKDKKWNHILTIPTDTTFSLVSTDKKESTRLPGAPFTTSTLQQEASRKLGLSVKTTMDVAQQLYQEWYITYMRTDSVNLSDLAINTAKQFIVDNFWAEYSLPSGRRFKTKQANAQEAHEAIRPAYIDKTPETSWLDSLKLKLYRLIWERTVASQMKEATIETTTFHFHPASHSDQTWIAKGEVIKFPGFMKLYIEGTDEEIEEDGAVKLPALNNGDSVQSYDYQWLQKFSQPPARYTEATLVKKLESESIGRPSTYAPTISTIIDRWYIERDEKKLRPTDIALVVTDFLDKNFSSFMQYNFTAKVEEEFDEIARGEIVWTEMLDAFYKPFHAAIEETIGSADRATGERILGKDPKTGQTVLVRMAKFGPVVQIGTPDEVGEEWKPRYTNFPPNQSIETITLAIALDLFTLPKDLGEVFDKPVVIGMWRFGPYIKFGEAYVSIPKGEDPLAIDLERAKILIEEKNQADAPIFQYDNKPVTKWKGRFGPFIKWNNLYINVNRTYDFDNLTEDDCNKLIDAKIKKEANRYIQRWEDQDIAIENGRFGPFIRFKKESIPLKRQGKKIAEDAISALTLEEVKAMILESNPQAFWKVKKPETSDSKPKKKTPTAKKKAWK